MPLNFPCFVFFTYLNSSDQVSCFPCDVNTTNITLFPGFEIYECPKLHDASVLTHGFQTSFEQLSKYVKTLENLKLFSSSLSGWRHEVFYSCGLVRYFKCRIKKNLSLQNPAEYFSSSILKLV